LRISGVAVCVTDAVNVAVAVRDAVNVRDALTVAVGVGVLLVVAVLLGVNVLVGVVVLLGVNVLVGVAVLLGVDVSLGVDVILGVNVVLGVTEGVIVGCPTKALVTALPASMIPGPHLPAVVHAFAALSAGKVVTLASLVIYVAIVSTDALGINPYNNAATPDTCGVAMLVPCI